jgi:hypothetical protein
MNLGHSEIQRGTCRTQSDNQTTSKTKCIFVITFSIHIISNILNI